MKGELSGQKAKIDEQIEQIKRVENDKNSLTYELNQNSLAIINSLSNTNSHQEYQRAKDMTSQLTNEVAQLKHMVSLKTLPLLRLMHTWQ